MKKDLVSCSCMADETVLSFSSSQGDLILSFLVFILYGITSKKAEVSLR